MKYFTYKNSTMSAPDSINLPDFPLLTTEDECSWIWYTQQVKQNMKSIHLQVPENDDMKFVHAKYYGMAYLSENRIHPEKRRMGDSLGV